MTTIVTRQAKGSALSWTEMDSNFTNLNDGKAEANNPVPSFANTAAIPAAYTGVARVGTDLYVGDGVNLSKELAYIYLPSSNTASQNTATIQAALDLTGDVYVVGIGVRLINATLIIKSNTKLTLSADLTLKLNISADCNLLRNAAASVNIQPTLFIRSFSVVTVQEKGHSRKQGDYVLISNLTSDTSFNGLFLINSTNSGVSWTYVSVGANGSPTGVGFVAPANNQKAASIFIRATNVVTVSETNHKRMVGDAVYIANLATDTSFNGNKVVTNIVKGVSWTYTSVGANGSPTGVGIINGDNNISITGGIYDGDSANQNIDYTASFGIIFGCASKIFIKNTVHLDQDKYALWLYNSTDIGCDSLTFNTNSDGLHFEGPCDRVSISNIYGSTTDDMVAFTNVASTSVYNIYMSPCGLGDFGDVCIDGIYLSENRGPAAVKITGHSTTSFKNLTINNVLGTFSSAGGYVVTYVDDGVGLTGMPIKNLSLKNIDVKGGALSSLVVSLSGSGGIENCSIEKVNWSFLSSFAITLTSPIKKLKILDFVSRINLLTGANIAIHCNAVIDDFILEGFVFNTIGDAHCLRISTGTISDLKLLNGKASSTGGLGVLIAQVGGTVSRLTVNNVSCSLIDSVLLQSGGSIPVFNINNLTCNIVTKGIQNATSMTINAVNIISTGVGNNFFQIAGGTVRINTKNCYIDVGQEILWNYNSSIISVNNSDSSFGIDMGNPAATKTGETPLVGDMHWNSNTTTKGLYGRSSANTWVKVF